MLTIGNIYGHGFDRSQLARLEALGFVFRPEASTYMGSQVCHFLDFPVGPSLELVEVTDQPDYESFVPPGMEPYCPGISLVVDGGSPAAFDAYERDFATLGPYRLHVPYRAGTGSEAPGWHYLNFARPVVPGTFVWLTAFDESKPIPATRTRHANGVRAISGLVFDLDCAGLASLSRLAGQPLVSGELQIGDVAVTAVEAGATGRQFPLRAVVLKADNLDGFAPDLRSDDAPARVMGRATRCIETNPSSWDLWITT
ncbi:MAG: hypothetical protein HY829_13460 [Actinobacteria bacterium]|nr:hypothetical protein [Actinomycetota bacterium]